MCERPQHNSEKPARGLSYLVPRTSSKCICWCQRVYIGTMLSLYSGHLTRLCEYTCFVSLPTAPGFTPSARKCRNRASHEFLHHRPPLHILPPTLHPQETHPKGTCIWKCRLILVCKIFTGGNAWSPTMSWHPCTGSAAEVSNCSACFSSQSQAQVTLR